MKWGTCLVNYKHIINLAPEALLQFGNIIHHCCVLSVSHMELVLCKWGQLRQLIKRKALKIASIIYVYAPMNLIEMLPQTIYSTSISSLDSCIKDSYQTYQNRE